MRPAYVWGTGFWSPGFPNGTAWVEGRPDPEVIKPSCAVLPSRQKRATSLVTRLAAEVAAQAVAEARVDPGDVCLIYGSALGEIRTAADQLDMMAGDDGRLSPARFKNSVHNAPVGLLSVAWSNRHRATALAAGEATFAMAVLEALVQLPDHDGPVVVAVADEPPGVPFVSDHPYEPLAVSFCFGSTPRPKRRGRLARFGRSSQTEPPIPPELAGNPAAAALPLFQAVHHGQASLVPLELNGNSPYCVSLDF